MVTKCPAKSWPFFPLPQDRSQTTPHKSVNVTERGAIGVLEVPKPASENSIELRDDGFQASATKSTRQKPPVAE